MRVSRRIAAALAAAVSTLCADALAQPPPPEGEQPSPAALALFGEGRKLMDAGDYDAACPKLAESLRLFAGPGTRFNLAECYEKQGKLTSAWLEYLEVVRTTAGQPEREALARERAAAVEPRLSRLRVSVSERVAGLALSRDGAALPEGEWGVAVPIDAGEHELAARAPARQPWSQRVSVDGEGAIVEVAVPALEPIPEPPPSELPRPLPPLLPPQRIAAIAVAGLGVVGFGVTTGLAVAAKNREADQELYCDGDVCEPAGVAINDDARALGDAATGTFIASVALVGGGAVLWLTTPDDAGAALHFGPSGGALHVCW